jgi:hypothetical protein
VRKINVTREVGIQKQRKGFSGDIPEAMTVSAYLECTYMSRALLAPWHQFRYVQINGYTVLLAQ